MITTIRRLATVAACIAALAAPVAIAGVASAAPQATARSCAFLIGHGKPNGEIARSWNYNIPRGCTVVFHVRTHCEYKAGLNNYLNGPTKSGNGSINSNYSQAVCNTDGVGHAYTIWEVWSLNGGVYQSTLLCNACIKQLAVQR